MMKALKLISIVALNLTCSASLWAASNPADFLPAGSSMTAKQAIMLQIGSPFFYVSNGQIVDTDPERILLSEGNVVCTVLVRSHSMFEGGQFRIPSGRTLTLNSYAREDRYNPTTLSSARLTSDRSGLTVYISCKMGYRGQNTDILVTESVIRQNFEGLFSIERSSAGVVDVRSDDPALEIGRSSIDNI